MKYINHTPALTSDIHYNGFSYAKLTGMFLLVLVVNAGCYSKEKVSLKTFPEIALVNTIDFFDTTFNQPRFSCGFLLSYHNDTFAITAKHLLKVIKTDEMKTLSFQNAIKSWSLYPLDKKDELITTASLLNENKSVSLDDKAAYNDDWLIFTVKDNHSRIKPLQVRTLPLVPGEKLYVIGWTRKMDNGPQRVYEFEYYKTIGQRILLKEIIVPGQFGGLSGAPLVDEQGKVVGIVSGATEDPATNKKHFSPCALDNLIAFIDRYQKK